MNLKIMNTTHTKKIILTALFSGLAVVLSIFHIPIGVMKVYPFQHMINAIAGVIIGPIYAAIAAMITGVIRNMLGTGTIFAFPGGIPGAAIVGLSYKLTKRVESALLEPIGTFIGALISPLIAGVALGRQMDATAFIIPFLSSSIPGTILGYVIIKVLIRE